MTESNTEFAFSGMWELDYKFSAFEGLKSKRGSEANKGEVKLIIEDELNENPDPRVSQLNTIEFISQNAEIIKTSLLTSLPEYYGDVKGTFGISDSDQNPDFPDVKSISRFSELFSVNRVYILCAEKDDFAYYSLEGGCTWDEEHGIGFIVHKSRILCIGQADILYDSMEPYKDNGTYELEQKRRKALKKSKPVFYKPHPKYGTLKPKQLSENEMFGYRLIERGYNAEFKGLVQTGVIDINEKTTLSMTFLARAIQFNNLEIGKYIFSLKPIDKKNVIQQASDARMVELCMANGIDINEEGDHKRTLYKITKQRMIALKNQLKFAKHTDPTDLNETEEFYNYIVSKGATE